YAEVEAGELKYVLKADLEKDAYLIGGTLEGQPISGRFEVKGGIMDRARTATAVCEVRDDKKPRVELVDYLPSTDPVGPTTMVVEKSTEPGSDVFMLLGKEQPSRLFIRLDAECEPERGSMQVGPMSL